MLVGKGGELVFYIDLGRGGDDLQISYLYEDGVIVNIMIRLKCKIWL